MKELVDLRPWRPEDAQLADFPQFEAVMRDVLRDWLAAQGVGSDQAANNNGRENARHDSPE